MSKKAKLITVGKGKTEQRFNGDYLRSISEELFIRQHPGSDSNRLRKVWKQANGFTVPNYENDDNKTEAKPKKVKEAKSKENEASVK